MRFKHEGTEYLIEFERSTKDRPAHTHYKREFVIYKPQYKRGFVTCKPQSVVTTARLFKITGPGKEDKEVVREYTVAHNHRDKFSLEGGRKAALTLALYDAPTKGGGAPLMGQALSKDFRKAVWTAYHNREGVWQPGKK